MTGDRRIRADLLFLQAAVHEVQHSCLPLLHREWICLDSYPAPTKAVIILIRVPQRPMPPSVSMSVIDSCVLGRPGGSWQYAPCSWPRHCCGAASLQIVIPATWTSFGDQLVELSISLWNHAGSFQSDGRPSSLLPSHISTMANTMQSPPVLLLLTWLAPLEPRRGLKVTCSKAVKQVILNVPCPSSTYLGYLPTDRP